MTNNGEGSKPLDSDFTDFLTESVEADKQWKVNQSVLDQIRSDAVALQESTGYLLDENPEKRQKEFDRLYAVLTDDYERRGEYAEGNDIADHVEQILFERLEKERFLEYVTYMQMAVSIASSKVDSVLVNQEMLTDKKRELIAEAVIVHGANPTDPIIAFMNAAIPGDMVVLDDPVMMRSYDAVIEKLPAEERFRQDQSAKMHRVLREIGVDESARPIVIFTVVTIIQMSSLERSGPRAKYLREERVFAGLRELMLGDDVARKLLDYINREYPLDK